MIAQAIAHVKSLGTLVCKDEFYQTTNVDYIGILQGFLVKQDDLGNKTCFFNILSHMPTSWLAFSTSQILLSQLHVE